MAKKKKRKLRKFFQTLMPQILAYLTVLILGISLILSALNTSAILKEKTPFVVWNPFSCPKMISKNKNLPIIFTNLGGSYSVYRTDIETNGFKCFDNKEKITGTRGKDTIRQWNLFQNQTKARSTFVIAKDKPMTSDFMIFEDEDYSKETAEFTITYSYITGEVWLPDYKIKECIYKKDFAKGWTLIEEKSSDILDISGFI